MSSQQVALVVVAGALGLMLLLLLVYGRPRRARQEPMPSNFSRGDPDSVLETSRLQKIQVWGVASSVFIAGFMAVYFVIEPFRESQWEEKFLEESVARGEHEYGTQGVNCAQCHGPEGQGGFAATDPTWPAPPLNNISYRYTRDQIKRIIQQGRPGTPMPTWGLEYGGPLNDQRVDDVVNFLYSIQVPADERYELPAAMTDGAEVYTQKCAACHGSLAGGQEIGRPLPTFYAPDLTTEFHRMGVKVLQERLMARDPTLTANAARAQAAAMPTAEILAAGEAAALNTIVKGRTNTPMPAWKDRIRPEQIDAVVGFIRSLQRTPG